VKRAVVVGSGPAGGTVARVLARSGLYDVLVLEKGSNYFTGLGGPTASVSNQFLNDEVGYEGRLSPVSQDPLLEPRSFRNSPEAGDRAFVGDVNNLPTTVGGGTTHYDAKARRFREVDFITNSLMGGTADTPAIPNSTYTDWPMTYHQIEPFYAVMEEVAGVQGPARRVRPGGRVTNPNVYESWRSTPFPMPPGVAALNSLLPSEAARRLGYHPAAVPTAVLSRPYRGRNACIDCSHCLGYGCPNNAKSGGVWQLQDALLTGHARLQSNANVVRVEWTEVPGGGHKATGVTWIDPVGVEHTEAADVVVLANSPIEAARLSFVSGIGRARPDEANLGSAQPTDTDPSGLLGRNLMFHYQSFVLAIVNRDIHSFRGRTSSHTLDAFLGSGPSAKGFVAEIPRGGIVEIGGNLNPVSEASQLGVIAYGARHKALMELGPFRKRLTTFTMQGEDMPQITNYVDLDPSVVDVFGQPVPRATYKAHPYELAAAAFYTPKMMEIMEAIGGPGSRYPTVRTVFAAPLTAQLPAILPGQFESGLAPLTSAAPASEVPSSAHIMGTHRMALDPGRGPCDPFGRYWAFDNLFHAGAGLFPTGPGFNPTLTIWALAYWVGAALVAGVGGQSGYNAAAIEAARQQMLAVMRTLDADTMIARAV
jgi:gluconate 2-dehydrogenase alpha chain